MQAMTDSNGAVDATDPDRGSGTSPEVERADLLLSRLAGERARLQAEVEPSTALDRSVLRAAVVGDRETLARLGLDLGDAWLDDVVTALVTGEPVHVETVGPYAAHHLDDRGRLDVRADNLAAEDLTGIALGASLRRVLHGWPGVQVVVLLDDLNVPGGRGLVPSDRAQFVTAMTTLLQDHGVLPPIGDLDGSYHVLCESDQLGVLPELVARLQDSPHGRVEGRLDDELVFWPTTELVDGLALTSTNRQRELRRVGIVLVRHGRPTCQALDASRFLDGTRADRLRVLMLGTQLRSQQDKTYAILRALDLATTDSFHNVFYDAGLLPPPLFALAVCELLISEVLRWRDRARRHDGWERFDPVEYAERNYLRRVLPADQHIVQIAAERLAAAMGSPPRKVVDAIDVGTGPNLYPAMLVAPYLAHDGRLALLEYAGPNRRYLEATLLDDPERVDPTVAPGWARFEDLMVTATDARYRGALDRVRRLAWVTPGSIWHLPTRAADLVTSFFVAESITTSRRALWQAIRSLARCLRPDGLLVAAHMLGSSGWPAGEGTHFPAVPLTAADLRRAYLDAGLDADLEVVGTTDADRAREGYDAMAVVVARHGRPVR